VTDVAGQRLVERTWELDAIGAAVDRLADGDGGVVVVEGPPGIGKSSLLAGLRELAVQRSSARVLAAAGAELEQTYAFGVARQLLEPVVREQREQLHGAAALAASALGLGSGDSPRGDADDASFAALHALYWLVADVAADRPLVLLVDDGQWADRNSARFLSFLANRVGEHPVLIALGLRTTGAEGERRGLGRLAGGPDATVLELRPLSEGGVADALGQRLGRPPDTGFARAVRDAVGGNPLLLDQLALELRRDEVDPTAEAIERLADLDPTGVARSVLVRLSALGDAEQSVARAVAVLGPGAPESRIAVVAELPVEETIEALEQLETADVLQAGTRAFAHAIVRDAVYRDQTAAARGLAHGRAARALVSDGEAAEQAAAHLLETPGVGDPAAIATLRKAAAEALARGAPESASRLLTRALEEPPSDELRGQVLSELGLAELRAGEPGAREHLRAAADATHGPGNGRVTALTHLGHAALLSGDMDGAVDAFGEAAVAEGATELRLRAQAELASALINSRRFDEAVEGLAQYSDLRGETPGERMVLAVSAFAAAQMGEPAEWTIELARRALASGRLLEEQSSSSLLVHEVAWALLFSGAEDAAERLLEDALADARRRGAVPGFALAGFGRAWVRLRRGDLAGARAEAESSFGTRELYRWHATAPLSAGLLVEALVEQGELDEADKLLADAGVGGEVPDIAIFNLPLYARGRLRIARGERASGVADVTSAGRREERVGGRSPGGIPWRSTAAEALVGGGDRDEARTLAEEELELARRLGSARATGVALRAVGLTRDGEQAIELLQESLAQLSGCEAALEQARTEVALGSALRRANRRGDAREHLRAALDRALGCDARPLAQRALEELGATGARPRRMVLSGVDALTPTELRIARMAAAGRSNPEIAQSLFVTRKNVEFHLSNAYRKLSISSRKELGDALSGRDGDEPG
jgi:DNA-binding CsgD family transcriptional regulator